MQKSSLLHQVCASVPASGDILNYDLGSVLGIAYVQPPGGSIVSAGGLSYMRGNLGGPQEPSASTVYADTLTSWLWPHENLRLSIFLNPRAWEAPGMAYWSWGCGKGAQRALLSQKKYLEEQLLYESGQLWLCFWLGVQSRAGWGR